jgi:hypothetical protein
MAMSYVDRNLLSGERVTFRGRLHWSRYLTPISWVFLSALLTLAMRCREVM